MDFACTTGDEPTNHGSFDHVDLIGLMEDGVLLAANEVFFWPLGLSLVWDSDGGNLHIRQWTDQEPIGLPDDDPIGIERRRRFALWLRRRGYAIAG